jgi:hypothetical protein
MIVVRRLLAQRLAGQFGSLTSRRLVKLTPVTAHAPSHKKLSIPRQVFGQRIDRYADCFASMAPL